MNAFGEKQGNTTDSFIRKDYIMKKNRRVIALVCAAVMIITSVSIGAIAAEPMTTNNVFRVLFNSKVRSGESSSSTSLGTAVSGSTLLSPTSNTTTYIYSQTKWTKLNWNSGFGYIRNDLICPDTTVYCATTSINVRDAASTSGTTLCTIAANTVLQRVNSSTYTGSGYSWYKVRVRTGNYEGTVGYVAVNYITYGY